MIVDKRLPQSALVLYAVLLANYLCWIFFSPGQWLSIIFLGAYIYVCRILILRLKLTWPLMLFVMFGILVSLGSPSGAWDARSIWLFHAKKIFIDHQLYAQLDNYGDSHSDYPVLVPAFSATLAKIVGYWNEVFPKMSSLFFLIPPLMLSRAWIKSSSLYIVLLIGLGLIGGAHLFDGYMDAILSLYVAAAVISIYRLNYDCKNGFSNEEANFLTALIPLVMLPLIKNEGLFLALTLLIAGYVFLRQIRKQIIFILVITVLFYFLTWKWPTLNANLHNDFLDGNYLQRFALRIFSFENWKILLEFFAKNTGIAFTALLIFTALSKPNRLLLQFSLCFCLIYLLFMMAVYFVTPLDFQFHLITSANRTLMPINITALLTLLYGLSDLQILITKPINAWIYRRSVWMRTTIQVGVMLCMLVLVGWYLKTPIVLEQKISFIRNGNGVIYLQEVGTNANYGWSHPEEWGVWLNGRNGIVHLPNPNFPSAKSLELVLRPFQYPGITTQKVVIRTAGQNIPVVVDNSKTMVTIALPVSMPWQNVITVEFEALTPRRPKELGLGNDVRLLSIGLISATFH